jgi:hypothetical protein
MLHTLEWGNSMSDTAKFETFTAVEQERIWQRYQAGDLDVEAATAQLLRLEIDEGSVARILRQTELCD